MNTKLLGVLLLLLLCTLFSVRAEGQVEGTEVAAAAEAAISSEGEADLLDEIIAEVQQESSSSKAAVHEDLKEKEEVVAEKAQQKKEEVKVKSEAKKPEVKAPEAANPTSVTTASSGGFLKPLINSFAALGRLWASFVQRLLALVGK